jgi:glycosyltransferase involved in cell wall biosynthesis
MARKNLSTTDVSSQAANDLEYVLTSDRKEKEINVPKMSVEEAMTSERVYTRSVTRDITRVLFISTNSELLNPTTQTLDGYVNIADLFEEVHILILRTGIPPKNPVLRVSPNVYMYTAAAPHWWQLPAAGLKMIEDQLSFASGFRPDLIVARDPVESALVALKISKQFERPAQLHIMEDYHSLDFMKASRSNLIRRFVPYYTVPRFLSVRTATDNLETELRDKYDVVDLSALPRLQGYEHIATQPVTVDVRAVFPQYSTILLFVGPLNHDSTLPQVIDAAEYILRNKNVGLIVIGEGPAKAEFQRRAKVRNVHEQVVFLAPTVDVVSYLKSADILIVTDTTRESEEVVLSGAAAKLPMLLAATTLRQDTFEHTKSALLFLPGDVSALNANLMALMFDTTLRTTLAAGASSIIATRYHVDPAKYRLAYRTSVEQALLIEVTEEA